MSISGLFSFAYNSLGLGAPQPSKARSLYVPDLFAGIMSGEPDRNQYETEVSAKSEAWTKESVIPIFSTTLMLTLGKIGEDGRANSQDIDQGKFRILDKPVCTKRR